MDYLLHLVFLCGIYSTLALATDLLVGYSGFLPLCQAAFYGVGAYSTAILATRAGVCPSGALIGGCVVALLCSVIVSSMAGRLRGDDFAVATLALQVVGAGVLDNWMELTGGPLGLSGIPPLSLLGHTVRSPVGLALISVSLCGVSFVLHVQIGRSPLGRVLRAIRESESIAQVAGKDVAAAKRGVFAVGAGLVGMAGGLYAQYMGYLHPSSFRTGESILVVSMLVVGGAGSSGGPLLGAVALVCLPEALRLVGCPDAVAAGLRQAAYGAALVAVVVLRPRGIIGTHRFGR